MSFFSLKESSVFSRKSLLELCLLFLETLPQGGKSLASSTVNGGSLCSRNSAGGWERWRKRMVMDFNTLFRSFWFYNNQPRHRHSLSMKMLPSLAIIDSSKTHVAMQDPPPHDDCFFWLDIQYPDYQTNIVSETNILYHIDPITSTFQGKA